MKQKEIIVDIAPDGSVKIEGNNFTGKGCQQATKWLELAMGKMTATKTKPEFYQQPKIQQKQTQ